MEWTAVIGQEEVKDRLRSLIVADRVPHALMLCGTTGYGSLALALAFASALLCDRTRQRIMPQAFSGGGLFGGEDPLADSAAAPRTIDDAEACGTCSQCKMLREWHHPDLHFTFPTVKLPSMTAQHKPVSDDFMAEWYGMLVNDGPYVTMNMWAERMKATTQQAIITAAESDAIARKLSLKSSQGGYKVAVVWLAERMNEESANKILKTLEEPAPDTVFILVVEQPERLLETILSRVQRIDVPPIGQESLAQALVRRRGLDEDTATRLARATEGNWIEAVEQLLPDSEQRQFLDLFVMLMRLVYKRDVKGMKGWSDAAAALGREKQKRMITYFLRMVREAFMSNFHDPRLTYMTREEEDFVTRFGQYINEDNVIEMTALWELALRDIAQNTNQKIVFYDTSLRLTSLLARR